MSSLRRHQSIAATSRRSLCFPREGPGVQAEEAHHVPAVEHHVRRPHPPRPHHARDGEGPDGGAQVRGHGGAGHAGDAVQEGKWQAGDLGECRRVAVPHDSMFTCSFGKVQSVVAPVTGGAVGSGGLISLYLVREFLIWLILRH